MISIAEARSRILQQAWRNPSTHRPLLDVPGLVLAEDVISDIDSPPHDRSLVDGFAVRSTDRIVAGTELAVIERVTAGELPTVPVRAGTAVQIMTGAPLPEGADAVVMVEQTNADESARPQRVCINAQDISAGQNIMYCGTALKRGAVVLPAGHAVRAVDVGLLAEVGCCRVPVIELPRVAVLATGNELIDARHVPEAGMIRNSNGPLLCVLAATHRAQICDLGIAPDQSSLLQQAIVAGLQHDVLVLSGGVSAGVLDLVPQVLQQLGVERIFHKVQLKPGKPLWFGVYRDQDHKCLVFGLPGNPVGSLVCFHLFVTPVLRTLSGHAQVVADAQQATLTVAHHHRSDRPTYHPARVEIREGNQLAVTPVMWRGSADQHAIARANCLVLFPPGSHHFALGESVEIVMLPRHGDDGP